MAEQKNNLFEMTDHTAEYDREEINKNRVFTIFAYIGILVLIPIFAAKDSKYARFHANNGLILAILEIGSAILSWVLGLIPYVGWLFAIPFYAIDVACCVLSVFGIINAATGKAKDLPVIKNFKILK